MSGVGGEWHTGPHCELTPCVRVARPVTVDDDTVVHGYCSYEHWMMDKRGESSDTQQG